MGVAWVGKQTRLRKIILSSGTLCPLRTSTAFAADPPVAISNVSIGSQCRSKRVQTEHRVQEEDVSRGNVLGQLRIAPSVSTVYLSQTVGAPEPWQSTALGARSPRPVGSISSPTGRSDIHPLGQLPWPDSRVFFIVSATSLTRLTPLQTHLPCSQD